MEPGSQGAGARHASANTRTRHPRSSRPPTRRAAPPCHPQAPGPTGAALLIDTYLLQALAREPARSAYAPAAAARGPGPPTAAPPPPRGAPRLRLRDMLLGPPDLEAAAWRLVMVLRRRFKASPDRIAADLLILDRVASGSFQHGDPEDALGEPLPDAIWKVSRRRPL